MSDTLKQGLEVISLLGFGIFLFFSIMFFFVYIGRKMTNAPKTIVQGSAILLGDMTRFFKIDLPYTVPQGETWILKRFGIHKSVFQIIKENEVALKLLIANSDLLYPIISAHWQATPYDDVFLVDMTFVKITLEAGTTFKIASNNTYHMQNLSVTLEFEHYVERK